VLCEGQVKLSISSSEGKTMILRIAKAGEVLGLMAVLSGSSYEVTAETLHPCQVVFIHRDEFLHFLTQHPEASQNMIKQLTAEYQSACEQLRTIGLSASIPGRLAKFLLDWSVGGQQTKLGTEFKISLTHEEIAECIGVTRETVSRTLGEFKIRHLVTLRGSTLMIPSRAALENIC
jgi:CRP/FNR family transcriptional regulator